MIANHGSCIYSLRERTMYKAVFFDALLVLAINQLHETVGKSKIECIYCRADFAIDN